jgi:predicted metal-dependent HD superfamily phosphohydrolase
VAILIDPPRWPAHGTHFSHLVSDSSLSELHEFAVLAGIPERAFDLDHYDVPAARYQELVARGAAEVSGGELVRRLIASGLRIPARRRSSKLETVLLHHWDRLLPGHPRLGRELVERWGEAHRYYHGRTHLLAVLEAVRTLLDGGEEPGAEPLAVWFAAWFHDAVYSGAAGRDEEDSARLAEDLLGRAGRPGSEIDETVRLVLLTATHRPQAGDLAGALLCDADLSVLGRDATRYQDYVQAVRKEYAHVPDADFAAGRAAVVRRLLELDPLFRTGTARLLWQPQAKANLAAEERSWAVLAGGTGPGAAGFRTD